MVVYYSPDWGISCCASWAERESESISKKNENRGKRRRRKTKEDKNVTVGNWAGLLLYNCCVFISEAG